MKPSAISQVIEQVVRISLVAACTKALLPYGIEYAAAGAMLSAVVGELMSLLYMLFVFKNKKSFRLRRKFFNYVGEGKETFRDLMRIALPTTGSRMIGSVAWFFEPIVVAQSLAIAGVATAMATKQYGELVGFALPLMMLPSFITYSLSTALVPAISEAAAKKNSILIEHRLQQALRLSFVTGGLAVVLLFVYAEPIMLLMYGSSKAAIYIKVMAPFFLFYYFQGPLQATLQALDLAKAAMINSFIGAAVKTAVIFVLASKPAFGIMGAALGIVIGMMLVTLLHMATIMKALNYSLYIRDYVKSFITMGICVIAGLWMVDHFLLGLGVGQRSGLMIILTCLLYLVLLLVFGLVKREELARLPFLKKWLAR